jgi:hypothetical protein
MKEAALMITDNPHCLCHACSKAILTLPGRQCLHIGVVSSAYGRKYRTTAVSTEQAVQRLLAWIIIITFKGT